MVRFVGEKNIFLSSVGGGGWVNTKIVNFSQHSGVMSFRLSYNKNICS